MSKVIIRTLSVIAFIGICTSAVDILPLVYEVGIGQSLIVIIGYLYSLGAMIETLVSGKIA